MLEMCRRGFQTALPTESTQLLPNSSMKGKTSSERVKSAPHPTYRHTCQQTPSQPLRKETSRVLNLFEALDSPRTYFFLEPNVEHQPLAPQGVQFRRHLIYNIFKTPIAKSHGLDHTKELLGTDWQHQTWCNLRITGRSDKQRFPHHFDNFGVCKKEEACFLADALPFVQAMKYTTTVLLSQIHKDFRTAKGVSDKD